MATTLDAVTVDVGAHPAQKGHVAVRLFRNYYVRKLFKALFTIWVVITLIFFMVRMLPGNPIEPGSVPPPTTPPQPWDLLP